MADFFDELPKWRNFVVRHLDQFPKPLIAAVNGINVILAPAFVFAYQHYGPAPFILNTALMAGMPK